MAIYDSQTTNNSKRSSRRFRDIDLDFNRNAVTNDVNVVEDVIAIKRAVKNFSSRDLKKVIIDRIHTCSNTDRNTFDSITLNSPTHQYALALVLNTVQYPTPSVSRS